MVDRLIQLTVRHDNLFLTEDLEGVAVKVGDGDRAIINNKDTRTINVREEPSRNIIATHRLEPGGIIDGVALSEKPIVKQWVLFEYTDQA